MRVTGVRQASQVTPLCVDRRFESKYQSSYNGCENQLAEFLLCRKEHRPGRSVHDLRDVAVVKIHPATFAKKSPPLL